MRWVPPLRRPLGSAPCCVRCWIGSLGHASVGGRRRGRHLQARDLAIEELAGTAFLAGLGAAAFIRGGRLAPWPAPLSGDLGHPLAPSPAAAGGTGSSTALRGCGYGHHPASLIAKRTPSASACTSTGCQGGRCRAARPATTGW